MTARLNSERCKQRLLGVGSGRRDGSARWIHAEGAETLQREGARFPEASTEAQKTRTRRRQMTGSRVRAQCVSAHDGGVTRMRVGPWIGWSVRQRRATVAVTARDLP